MALTSSHIFFVNLHVKKVLSHSDLRRTTYNGIQTKFNVYVQSPSLKRLGDSASFSVGKNPFFPGIYEL